MRRSALRFIDLFAGLGGFHVALNRLGHRCVFACEIDDTLRELYSRNFAFHPAGDIREVDPKDIPPHDLLCAGSPCQPFSKAGDQLGLACPKSGDLFDYVLAILEHHAPTYLLLENVPHLTRHRRGKTWTAIQTRLRKSGYETATNFLSPHHFGVPQVRDRVFVVGSKLGLSHFAWPRRVCTDVSIRTVLDRHPSSARPLSPQFRRCLAAWQKFVKAFPAGEELPSFPIWSMEFGATYPFEEVTPYTMGPRRLRRYRGAHGERLAGLPDDAVMQALPSYARTMEHRFPDWKIDFIRRNRELYARHKRWIDKWLPTIVSFPASLQKLEWNCKGGERNVWNYVIQFRASGVRLKRPTASPSLVAMTTTQVPIIGWERRYMTPLECARLQSLGHLKELPRVTSRAFKALGNAVNAVVVEHVARELVGEVTQQRPSRRGKRAARKPAART
jgi:DNA (cytosine-5)-methyltransferase 1